MARGLGIIDTISDFLSRGINPGTTNKVATNKSLKDNNNTVSKASIFTNTGSQPKAETVTPDYNYTPDMYVDSSNAILNNIRKTMPSADIELGKINNGLREAAVANLAKKQVSVPIKTDREIAIERLQKELGPKATEAMPKDFFISSDNRPGQSQTETSLKAPPRMTHEQRLALLNPDNYRDDWANEGAIYYD